MKTCIKFLAGKINEKLDIEFDNELSKKIKILKENNKVKWYTVFNNYILYFDPQETNNLQNSIFHHHTGHVFITCQNRDFTNDDKIFWEDIVLKTKKKGKGIYLPEPQKFCTIPKLKKNKGIIIN